MRKHTRAVASDHCVGNLIAIRTVGRDESAENVSVSNFRLKSDRETYAIAERKNKEAFILILVV
jgi:hypothetical protein